MGKIIKNPLSNNRQQKTNKRIKKLKKMKKYLAITVLGLFVLTSCGNLVKDKKKTRDFVDTVGYATKAWQMDSIMGRIERIQKEEYESHLKFKDFTKTD